MNGVILVILDLLVIDSDIICEYATMLATHAQYACMYRSRVPICSEGISTLDHMKLQKVWCQKCNCGQLFWPNWA